MCPTISNHCVTGGNHVRHRVFWLELDDKALWDSYGVLQEGILYDVFRRNVLLLGKAHVVNDLQ